jgi:hypothetical protein
LSDAFNGADHEEDERTIVSRQIEDYRDTLENLASFQRAKSLGRGKFQLFIAKLETDGIFAMLTSVHAGGFCLGWGMFLLRVRY